MYNNDNKGGETESRVEFLITTAAIYNVIRVSDGIKNLYANINGKYVRYNIYDKYRSM